MKNWPAIALFTLAFLPSAAHAAEYVVSAENGKDSNPGTAIPYLPWKTLQKAADVASGSDRVRVEAGTYSQRVIIKNSGTSPASPLVFEGVPPSNGTWGTILDGSDAVTGTWEKDTSFTNGLVWRTTLPYKAYGMTTSDDKTIWRIDDDIWTGNHSFSDINAREIIARPSDFTQNRSMYMGSQVVKWWDGVGALFTSENNNNTILRLRNGQNPATRGVRSSPRAGVITLNNVRNVVIRNFKFRGGYYGVHILGGASDNVIENNFMINGKSRVFIANGSRNIVRNNELTMNGECCATYLPGEWGGFNYERAIMFVIYIENKFIVGRSSEDDRSIFMLEGADNQFVGNHIYNGVVGVHLEGGRGTKIMSNTIHNISAEGVYSTEEESAEIAHNLMYDNDHNIRIALEHDKTLHIYANRFFEPKLTAEDSGGKHIHLSFTRCSSNCTSLSKISIYHNSFAGGGWAIDGGGQGGIAGLKVANNLFSTRGLQSSYSPSPVGVPYDERLKISLWYNNTMPNFIPPAEARNSAPHDLSGWPGMTAAYYQDGDPDYGAIQGNGTPAGFDFSLTDGGNKTVTRGSSVTSAINTTLNSGGAQSVSFSVSGLPSGVTGAFSPTSCSPSCSTTLTLSASAAAAIGVHSITVTAAGGGLTRTDSFNLTVSAPPAGGTETLHFEAEAGTLTAPMAAANDVTASLGRYAWVPAGLGMDGPGKVSHTFTVTAAGPFWVWGRVAQAGGNSFHVSMDGNERTAWHTTGSTEWTWEQVKITGGVSAEYSLAPGVPHTLTIYQREAGTKLDRLVVTNDPNFVPTDDPVSNPPPARPRGLRLR